MKKKPGKAVVSNGFWVSKTKKDPIQTYFYFLMVIFSCGYCTLLCIN